MPAWTYRAFSAASTNLPGSASALPLCPLAANAGCRSCSGSAAIGAAIDSPRAPVQLARSAHQPVMRFEAFCDPPSTTARGVVRARNAPGCPTNGNAPMTAGSRQPATY